MIRVSRCVSRIVYWQTDLNSIQWTSGTGGEDGRGREIIAAFDCRIVLWWFEGYNNGKSEYFKTANAGKSVYDLSELKSTVREELWDEFSFGIGVTTYNAMIDFIQHPRKTRLKEFVGS